MRTRSRGACQHGIWARLLGPWVWDSGIWTGGTLDRLVVMPVEIGGVIGGVDLACLDVFFFPSYRGSEGRSGLGVSGPHAGSVSKTTMMGCSA